MEEYMDCLDVIQVAAARLVEIDLEIELTAATGHYRASALLSMDKEDHLTALIQAANRVRELSRMTNG